MAALEAHEGSALSAATGVETRALKISQLVAAVIALPRQADLRGQLDELATVLAGLSGVPGAMIVAFDEEGTPLTSGACRLSFSGERSQLEILFDLHQQLAPQMAESAWTAVTPSFVRAESGQAEGGFLWSLPVCSVSKTLGLVLVAISDCADSKLSLQAIAQCGDILAAAIQSSLRTEAWNRIEKLQQLAWKTFAQLDWDLWAWYSNSGVSSRPMP